jgi:hypothetical protein
MRACERNVPRTVGEGGGERTAITDGIRQRSGETAMRDDVRVAGDRSKGKKNSGGRREGGEEVERWGGGEQKSRARK